MKYLSKLSQAQSYKYFLTRNYINVFMFAVHQENYILI